MTILSDFDLAMCRLINANWAFSNIKYVINFFDFQLNGFFTFFRPILKLNFCLIKNETNKGLGKCIFMHNGDCLHKNRRPLYASEHLRQRKRILLCSAKACASSLLARALTPAEAGQLGQALSQTKRHEAQSLADRE